MAGPTQHCIHITSTQSRTLEFQDDEEGELSLRWVALWPPNPRSSRRRNFKISTTRHGVINWEEFWKKICGSFCTANEARKCAEIFAPILRPDFRPSHKNLSPQFRSGEVRRKVAVTTETAATAKTVKIVTSVSWH